MMDIGWIPKRKSTFIYISYVEMHERIVVGRNGEIWRKVRWVYLTPRCCALFLDERFAVKRKGE